MIRALKKTLIAAKIGTFGSVMYVKVHFLRRKTTLFAALSALLSALLFRCQAFSVTLK